jgi:2-keto-4-pentenoate hydratase/2-oxohepta-3-ene-1,7-dioic acid hydratase in catechol pathway
MQMRWVRFDDKGTPAYAIMEGDKLLPVHGTPFGKWEKTGEERLAERERILIPVVPPTFYACGLNYVEHIRAVAERVGLPTNLPDKPDVGYRANNSLIANGEPILIPADATDAVQYEAELVVVIGRKARRLTRENALGCVLGYTIGNDVSERTWQKSDRTLWRAKNTDTFAPMGPWIETDVDLDSLVTKVRLNGREVISFPTNHMLFGVVDYLVAITGYCTLYPGDVVWMGTEGQAENLKHGDVCEIEITGIGTLTNPVARLA